METLISNENKLNGSIKKIPIELRKYKFKKPENISPIKIFFLRIKNDSQFFRSVVQFLFLVLVLWIGWEFHLFVKWGLSNGVENYFERPPGVEGFLPISALMSLKFWLETGILNSIHPASVFIFVAILLIGLFTKKAFCSWLCPVGTISESLYKFGQKIFKKNLTLPKFLDWPLRSIKYLLLLFFVWAILTMSVFALDQFIYSPYNKVSDIKMYLFFAEISSFSMIVILILILLSVIIKNFWCRYLCPYGALLGFLSFLSPIKITRNKTNCIDCNLCDKVCPGDIKIHAVKQVWSDECTACLNCVEVCPVKNTLDLRISTKSKFALSKFHFGIIVTGIFIIVTGLAIVSGNWKNSISKDEYLMRFGKLDSPVYQHAQGEVPKYKKTD